jgi:hypothetical protein
LPKRSRERHGPGIRPFGKSSLRGVRRSERNGAAP